MEQLRNESGHTRKLYTIFDKKTGTWDNPFTAITHGEAERTLQRVVGDTNTVLAQHPEDFSLWHLGSFDPFSGIIDPVKPYHILELVSLTANKKSN